MGDFQIENVMILLDTSRSTLRNDFRPNRLDLIYKALEIYLVEKNKIDPNDQVGILVFGNEIDLVSPLTKDLPNLVSVVNSSKFKKSHPPQGDNRHLIATLERAIDILGEKIRTIGGQIYRILLLTDRYTLEISKELTSVVEKAQGLNIHIDVCIFHKKDHEFSRQDYLFITNTTGGELGNFYNKKALLRGMQGFASKKIISDESIRLLSPKIKEDGRFLAEIAQSLRKPTEEELELQKKNKRFKCQICFTDTSPISQQNFLLTGRFCSYCNTPMHLHCAGMWARKTEVAPNLFRCPHCYTLLKIDPSVTKGLIAREQFKTTNNLVIKMIRANFDPKISQETTIDCGFCYQSIQLDETQKIFQCSHCKAYYHVECLEKMYKDNKRCHNCYGKIV